MVRSEQTEERWLIAELLRVKGETLLWRRAPGAAAEAEGHFRRALDLARQHHLELKGLSVQSTSLDDVFLHYTGHGLAISSSI